MNQVIISGRLTKTPDVRMTESRKKVVSGTVAVQRNKETTDFIDFVAWETLAERLEKYTDKGCRVIITGELQTRTYEKGDKKVKVVELFARNIEIIDFKAQTIENVEIQVPVDTSKIPVIEYDINPDDLPF